MSSPTVAAIQKATADYFRIPLDAMMSRRRKRVYAYARMVAMFTARQMTNFSYPQLGEFFYRDHSTVIHGVNLIQNDKSAHEIVRAIKRIVLDKKGFGDVVARYDRFV